MTRYVQVWWRYPHSGPVHHPGTQPYPSCSVCNTMPVFCACWLHPQSHSSAHAFACMRCYMCVISVSWYVTCCQESMVLGWRLNVGSIELGALWWLTSYPLELGGITWIRYYVSWWLGRLALATGLARGCMQAQKYCELFYPLGGDLPYFWLTASGARRLLAARPVGSSPAVQDNFLGPTWLTICSPSA